MTRREELLLDHVYIVGGKFDQNVPAPNGIVDENIVEGIQTELLTNMMEHLGSTLIDVKKSYPSKDTVDLMISSDFVVMRRKEFDELFRATPEPVKLELEDIHVMWSEAGTTNSDFTAHTTSSNGQIIED